MGLGEISLGEMGLGEMGQNHAYNSSIELFIVTAVYGPVVSSINSLTVND